MKGYEYANYMTLKEWKQWRNNMVKRERDISNVLKKIYVSFWMFISSYFLWKHSKEGYNYWEKIAERKEPLTK